VWRAFALALQFLTRLPVRLRTAPRPSEFGSSLYAYPWVGWLIGASLAAFDRALQPVHLSGPLHAMLMLTGWVLLTGGLHLDGLADSADAWVGGQGDRERTLQLMKDPHVGVMAVLALALVLGLKVTGLQALVQTGVADTDEVWHISLALPPVIARTLLPLLFVTTDYVRPGGLGAMLAQHQPVPAILWSAALSGAALWLAFGVNGLLTLAAGAACAIGLRSMMIKRLAGFTGDTAGAMVELVEVVTLLALVAIHA